jgi:hypothetical protein
MAGKRVSKYDCLRKYEKYYDKDDVILFNSRLLNKGNNDEIEREKGIMSNLYCGGFKIPFDNKEFHSSEQLLFYLNIIRWAKIVGYDDVEIGKRIDYLMNCKNGFIVKNTGQSMYFYEDVVKRKERLIGVEQAAIDCWKNQYFILQLKYRYCKEFREVLDKYKEMIWCENSDKPTCKFSFAGVIWDEQLQKYRGCNVVARAMRRVYNERDLIMGEA